MTSVTQNCLSVAIWLEAYQGYGHYQENHFQNSFQRWLAKKPCFSKARRLNNSSSVSFGAPITLTNTDYRFIVAGALQWVLILVLF